jgi:hypothetical protein
MTEEKRQEVGVAFLNCGKEKLIDKKRKGNK